MSIIQQNQETSNTPTNQGTDRQDALPALLKLQAKNQWVNYDAQKAPHTPDGGMASSADKSTWSSYEAVTQAYDASQLNGRKLVGVGYVFNRVECGIDLDHCVEDGVIDAWAQEIIDLCDSYTEFSPSGTGVHILVYGVVEGGNRYVREVLGDEYTYEHGAKFEMYSEGRYFTVTGNHVPGTPEDIKPRQAQALKLAEKFLKRDHREVVVDASEVEGHISHTWSDEELLERARNAQNGGKFSLLWEGEIAEAGYGSPSEADSALCVMLAFWTGRNVERIDSLFRQSGLMRTKWDRNARSGEVYGDGTILRAVEHCEEVYTPATTANIAEGTIEDVEPRQVPDAELLKFDADDYGNAMAVKALYGDKIIHTKAYGWMVWNGTHWVRDEATVRRMVNYTLVRRRVAAVHAGNEAVVRAAKNDDYRVKGCLNSLWPLVGRGEADVDVFDNYPDLLNVKNGVLNLRTGEVAPHKPSQLFTYCMSVEYNKDASQEKWTAFLNENVSDADSVVPFLQEAVGYSLTGHVTDECLFYIFGPTRGGKGTFVEVLRALLTKPLSEETTFGTFTSKRDGSSPNYDLAPLKPARVVVASESEKKDRLNGAMLKNITGGGAISCELKYHDRFSYIPQFKIWLTTNWPVNGDPDDGALWNRLRVVEFPNSYEGREDPSVKKGLKQQDNLEGVLAWAVEGALRWYERGKLEVPESCGKVKEAHREQADSVGQWLEECCEISPNAFTPTASARSSYEHWCGDNGFEAKGGRAFNLSLQRKGCIPQYQQKHGGTNIKGIKGLEVLQG